MSLTLQDVRKIAKLARIELSEEEEQTYLQELGGILHWVEQLQSVETEGVPGMTSVADLTLPMRKDEVTDGGIPEKVLANAPEEAYHCFVVPKVVE